MSISIITTLFITALIIVGVYLVISFWRKPLLSAEAEWLTTEELSTIEMNMKDCKEVILWADQIHVPSREDYKEMYFAVIDNFAEGVEYNFLVPEEFYRKHAKRITKLYESLMHAAAVLRPKPIQSRNLFKLHKYPHSKNDQDYPYLFYRFAGTSGMDELIAFRGEDKGVGIAQHYRRLEPEIAKTILQHALPYIHDNYAEKTTAGKYTHFSQDNVVSLATRIKREEACGK